MTRNGTVGRSDGTEGSLALRWDVDPVRVMKPRFADSIRASSRFGLHQQAALFLRAASPHHGPGKFGCWASVTRPKALDEC